MIVIKILSRLPFYILYPLSDLLAIFLQYIVRYRRDVIDKNLRNSFPEKNKVQLRHIRNEFYRNFTDVFLETIKLLTIHPEELVRRTRIRNVEMINSYLQNGQSLIAVTSHYNNWEWLLATCSIQFIHPPDAVYLRVKNDFFENLMLKIRSRFGAYLIEKKYVLSESYKRKPLPRVIALVADQTMFGERSLHWLEFLNQSTPFINGPERISKILNLPVVYGIMKRVKRGYYETEFVYIEKDPEHSLPNQITEKFASVLEKTILASPPSWLWSHNRWKNKKPDTPVA